MALKVELKPGEKMIIGETVITNGDVRAHLTIDGDEPLLREKDIMRRAEANTPAKRIYLAVQMLYLTKDEDVYRELYENHSEDFLHAVPSSENHIREIKQLIDKGHIYKALKAARALLKYEDSILNPGKTDT